MTSAQPHFFLRCEARVEGKRGEWTFALNAADGSAELTACDEEFDVTNERLELLAVIRALEALDQPSVVTITSGARTVRRAVAEGLDEWRRNGWMWECYGEMAPIKNRDLWQRLDRALCFHRLETRRVFRVDAAHIERPTGEHSSYDLAERRLAYAAEVEFETDVLAAATDESNSTDEHGDARTFVAATADDTNEDEATEDAPESAAAIVARRVKETYYRVRRRGRSRSEGLTMASAQFGSSLSAGTWRI